MREPEGDRGDQQGGEFTVSFTDGHQQDPAKVQFLAEPDEQCPHADDQDGGDRDVGPRDVGETAQGQQGCQNRDGNEPVAARPQGGGGLFRPDATPAGPADEQQARADADDEWYVVGQYEFQVVVALGRQAAEEVPDDCCEEDVEHDCDQAHPEGGLYSGGGCGGMA